MEIAQELASQQEAPNPVTQQPAAPQEEVQTYTEPEAQSEENIQDRLEEKRRREMSAIISSSGGLFERRMDDLMNANKERLDTISGVPALPPPPPGFVLD